MFENMNSLSVSGGRGGGLRLESLEDRTTPAVVSTLSSPLGSFAANTAALNGVTLATNAGIDRAFLSEVARTSVMQWFLATTEANQGSNPQIRAFAQQLATNQLNLFNQLLPVLNRSGLSFQLNQVDQALVNVFPTLSGANLDTQFLFFNSLYGLQGFGLAQTAGQLGSTAGVRAFAQSALSPLQTQLQTGFGFLGTGATTSTLNMFSTLNGFGPFSTTLGTNGFGTFGTTTGFAGVAPSTTAPVVGLGVNTGFDTVPPAFTSSTPTTGTFGSTTSTGVFGSTATGTGTFSTPGTGTFTSPGTGTFTSPGTGTFTSPGTGTFGSTGTTSPMIF